MKPVMHQVGATERERRPARSRRTLRPDQLVVYWLHAINSTLIEAAQVERGRGTQELLGMQEREDHRLAAIIGNILVGRQTAFSRREQPVQVSRLHRAANALIIRNHPGS